MPRLDPHTHYQLRLVKRIDGAKIVTYPPLATVKAINARDKTLDLTVGSEKGALRRARDYCRRGTARKGDLPGDFVGVVVVKHTSNSNKPITVSRSGFEVTKRPRRVPSSTSWLYFVDADGNAFSVDPSNHNLLESVP